MIPTATAKYLNKNLQEWEVSLQKLDTVLLGQGSQLAVFDDEILHGARPLRLQVLVRVERQDVLVEDGAKINLKKKTFFNSDIFTIGQKSIHERTIC
jgi:hypothetical protein